QWSVQRLPASDIVPAPKHNTLPTIDESARALIIFTVFIWFSLSNRLFQSTCTKQSSQFTGKSCGGIRLRILLKLARWKVISFLGSGVILGCCFRPVS